MASCPRVFAQYQIKTKMAAIRRNTDAIAHVSLPGLKGQAVKGLVAWIDYTHLNCSQATHEFNIAAVLLVRGNSPKWPQVKAKAAAHIYFNCRC